MAYSKAKLKSIGDSVTASNLDPNIHFPCVKNQDLHRYQTTDAHKEYPTVPNVL